jgi:hypothetical protein
MYPRATEVSHLGDYRLMVTFEDGVRAQLDFAPMVQRGGIYASLADPQCFGRVRIDREAETLIWPGGIDVCPDVLYHLATGSPLPGELPQRPANLIRLERPAVATGS